LMKTHNLKLIRPQKHSIAHACARACERRDDALNHELSALITNLGIQRGPVQLESLGSDPSCISAQQSAYARESGL